MKWFLTLCLAIAVPVCAQETRDETESEGMSRIMNPTLNPATGVQDKAFYGGADKGFSTSAGNVKSFQWSNVFRMKSFSGSKDFNSKNYWTGNYESGLKQAQTQGNYGLPELQKEMALKTNPVSDAREAGKTQATRDYDKNRPYLIPGKAQKAIDSQQEAQKPLTVDDVRKLLNTTR